MNAPPGTRSIKTFARTRGEVQVWVCSMGLTVGLVMVGALLLLIVVNGLEKFWPDPVAVLELRAPGGETTRMAGVVVKTQERRVPSADGTRELEYQLFIANRDTYGASFKYFPASDVVAISHPADLLMVERMEYGNALGVPETITRAGGQTVPASSPEFQPLLDSLTTQAARRRGEIERIEKADIGRINAVMTRLRNRQRALDRSGGGNPAEAERITQRTDSLQGEYEELAARARTLRRMQEDDVLTLRLVSGQQRDITFGNIVHTYYPNQLGLPGKAALFAYNFWNFLSSNPREANTEGGIFPALFGTFVMTLLMSVAVMPFGVVAAIYLREYAVQGFLVRAVRIAVNNLAGVPSIVFGVFGLGFFVYFLGGTIDSLIFKESLPTPTFGTGGIFWAALTLALMTVPVVIVATEEALAAVPRGVREGSLACGASKWQTIQRIVIPAAAPGILTGLILAMARGAGEVAPLMLVGVVKLAPSLPLDGEFPFIHLERKFMHLGFHIYDLGFQSPDSEAAKPMVFATTLLLILLVVVLNLTAIIIRERLRKKYASASF